MGGKMDKPDPRGQIKCLVKHFFMRFFDFEAISSPNIDSIEKNALTFQVIALLVLPGLMKSLAVIPKYGYYCFRPVLERDLATITDKCFFLSLSMVLIGIITVYEWDMLFPDRKDYSILTVFPVSIPTVFTAKIAALAAFLLIFTIAINLCATFLFPTFVLANNSIAQRLLGKTIPIALTVRYIFSHAVSVLLGNIFIFLSVITLQGLLLLNPAAFAPALSRFIRFLCLLLLLCVLFSFAEITAVDQLISDGNPMVIYFPPIWFVGIYEVLLGSHDPAMWNLAVRAMVALALAGVLSVLSYALCYGRFMRKSIESGSNASYSAAGIRAAGNRMLDRRLIDKPESRACFHFVGQTILRSPRHVLYVGTFFVVGFSLAAMELATMMFGGPQSLTDHQDHALLSIPLILSFFLLVGMRVCFAIPVDLDANWLFRLAPMQRIKEYHAGVRRFLIGVIIIPLFALVGIFHAMIWDWQSVLLHIGYGIALSLLLLELLFLRFPKMPFTCSYLPGAARIVVFWPFYVLGFKLFGYAAANLEIWLLSATHRFLYFYGLAAALLLILINRNAKSAGAALRFEEESEKAPIYLDLRS